MANEEDTPRLCMHPTKKWLREHEVSLVVKTLVGRTLMITARLDDTVGMIKDRIANKDGTTSADAQDLLYRGVKLLEGRTLHDCGVYNGASLFSCLPIRGGGGLLTASAVTGRKRLMRDEEEEEEESSRAIVDDSSSMMPTASGNSCCFRKTSWRTSPSGKSSGSSSSSSIHHVGWQDCESYHFNTPVSSNNTPIATTALTDPKMEEVCRELSRESLYDDRDDDNKSSSSTTTVLEPCTMVVKVAVPPSPNRKGGSVCLVEIAPGTTTLGDVRRTICDMAATCPLTLPPSFGFMLDTEDVFADVTTVPTPAEVMVVQNDAAILQANVKRMRIVGV